jgi:hypothetical protein
VSDGFLDLADPDRCTTTELLLHAIPVSEWRSDFAWCASCLIPSGEALLDHIVVVNYRANVPLALVLEEFAQALRKEQGVDLDGIYTG